MSKTIRVIDLLNKIANGEDVPELIEYNGENYIFQNKDYKNEDRDLYLFSEETPDITAVLNDEVKIVEILEEQEEIDIQEMTGLDEFDIQGLEVSGYSMTQAEYLLEGGIKENRELINEILKWAKQLDKKTKEKK